MSLSTLKSLFGHKARADAELFAKLATLPPEHADQLHTCLRTLSHIHIVDRIFHAHLSGEPRPFDATHAKEVPPLEQLRQEVEATDAWYLAYVGEVTEASLSEALSFTFTDGDAGRMTREEMLLHVITHGSNHRGNVGQVLKSISVAPPRDLYTRFLHLSEPARRQA